MELNVPVRKGNTLKEFLSRNTIISMVIGTCIISGVAVLLSAARSSSGIEDVLTVTSTYENDSTI